MRTTYFFLFIIIIFYSCESTYTYEYIVQNETPHKIKILGFDRISQPYDSKTPSESIYLEPYSSHSVLKEMGYHAEDPGIFETIQIGSVNIIFNDSKVIIQFCSKASLRDCQDIPRNILGMESGSFFKEKTGRSSGENEYRYTYTITEEDYNNAVPIEN